MIPAACAGEVRDSCGAGVARAASPGRSRRPSGASAHSEVAALRHPACAGHQRRLDGTDNPSLTSGEEWLGKFEGTGASRKAEWLSSPQEHPVSDPEVAEGLPSRSGGFVVEY